MIRNRILLKSIAVFLILETVFNTVAPTISWALTSGPTAPEATSFEPIDTTDMVNLATGDLAYNIPLLEVPGPSGGYPLGLSYHAGIQPNEDASWTGLGWTLNPGAIVRNVNGFADDHMQVENSTRFFWNGGKTETYTAGVTLGIAGTPASVSAGLSFSQDTYQGRGVGGYLGVGFQFGDSPVGLGATIGISAYGDSYASAGLSLSTPIGKTEKSAIGLSGAVGISTNFDKVNAYADAGASVTYGNKDNAVHASLLGANISTGSGGFSASSSMAGASFVNNNNSGRVSSYSSGLTVPIPVWYGVSISLGYNYRRYWIDEMKSVKINGALNYPTPTDPNAVIATHDFDDTAYDTYSILQLNSADSDPNKVLGGSFPEYDNYQVHAQGVFGAMRPYYFQKHLYKRNTYQDNGDGKDYKIIQYDLARNQTKDTRRAEFRFINDFSNRFEYTPDKIHHVGAPYADNNPQYHFDSGTGLKVGENGDDGYGSNLMQGSRSVLWFTNKEIVTKDSRVTNAGFVDTRSSGFNRGNTSSIPKPDQIGGYTITNESGVKYHFSLPAYSYSEYIYSGSKTGANTFNEFYKREPYAYTWYLTAITGPDYVDRGPDGVPDGILNKYDWGYWVEFEYGKWSDQYVWRNPSESSSSDIDHEFENFSEGKKEIYYLDAIRTKTHTALFFKDIRKDAKGSLYFLRNLNKYTFPSKSTKEEIVAQTKEGGFVPKQGHCSCQVQWGDQGQLDYYALPTSTMKLNSIVLIDNESLNSIPLSKSSGQAYSQNSSYTWSIDKDRNPDDVLSCDFSPLVTESHLYYNVLDVYDYANVQSTLSTAALRSIDFTTSYSLSPGTPNSFDNSLINPQNPSTADSNYPRSGKLTLESISFRGKGGASLIPPMKFNYELADPLAGSSSLYTQSGDYFINVGQTPVQAGDILKLTSSVGSYYAAVKKQASGICTLKFPSGNIPATGFYTWQQTKNPGYNKDAYDTWGLYKSDYDASLNSISENIARQTSDISGKGTDAWSLRSVQTSQGSEIAFSYESDVYSNAMFSETNLMYIDNLVIDNQHPGYINVDLSHEVDLSDKFVVNEDIELYAFLGVRIVGGNGKSFRTMTFAPFLDRNVPSLDYTPDYAKSTVKSVGENSIVIFNQVLYDYLNAPGDFSAKAKDFLGGNIKLLKDHERVGGGLRLAEISVNNDTQGKSFITRYSYQTGVSAYPPVLTSTPHLTFPTDDYYSSESTRQALKADFSKFLNFRFFELLVKARELPPPGVLYSNVTVNEYLRESEAERKVPNYTSYEFEVFDPGMVDIAYNNYESSEVSNTYDFVSYHRIVTQNVVLKDYTSRLGSLNRTTLYSDHGEKISETITDYLHDDAEKQLADSGYPKSSTDFTLKANKEYFETLLNSGFNNQGVIEETFTDARFTIPLFDVGTKFVLQGVVTKREQYPSVRVGQTTINYKTGITTTTRTLAYDYYSGQATRSQSNDGYGNVYVTESTPAYRQYSAMGLAASGGKNMLTQEAASYTYKVDPAQNNKKTGLVSASVQTWSDQLPALQQGKFASEASKQPGIWRMASNFTFIGSDNVSIPVDGLYPASSVTIFNAWNINDPVTDGWQKTSAITLYDVHSHALEAIDINSNYAATRMSPDQSRVVATAANANYREFAYSGAEDKVSNTSPGSEVNLNGTPATTMAHTGSISLMAAANTRGFTYYMETPRQNKYRVSVWSSQPAASIKYKLDSSPESIASVNNVGKAGNWYLLEADIAVTATNASKLELWCEAGVNTTYFDDFRVRPIDAAMTGYVYNPWGEVSHILDNNNLYTEYRYDAMGRLTSTYKESFKAAYGNQGIVKTGKVEYNYGTNNAYTLTINASNTGTRGYIYPSGNVTVVQGRDLRFELRDKCQSNTLGAVWIDGKKIDLDKASLTLADGTMVSIQGAGKVITFKNVQTAHTLKADFASNSVAGIVVCNGITDGNGNTCFDGGYRYAYYDLCGNQGSWMSASRKSEIPADLRSMAVDNCCQYNNGTVSGCSCKPGSTGIE